MASRRRRGLVLLALGGVPLAVLAFLFLPAKAGGSVQYVKVTGISMEPRLRQGDLVLTRPRSRYRVGDVAAYRNSYLGGLIVLHRIIAATPQELTLKGDNNNYVDSPKAKRGDVLGTEWIRIPKAIVLPVEAAAFVLLLGLAALVSAGLVLALNGEAAAPRHR
jgi:signal peptidase I